MISNFLGNKKMSDLAEGRTPTHAIELYSQDFCEYAEIVNLKHQSALETLNATLSRVEGAHM